MVHRDSPLYKLTDYRYIPKYPNATRYSSWTLILPLMEAASIVFELFIDVST